MVAGVEASEGTQAFALGVRYNHVEEDTRGARGPRRCGCAVGTECTRTSAATTCPGGGGGSAGGAGGPPRLVDRLVGRHLVDSDLGDLVRGRVLHSAGHIIGGGGVC